MAEALINLLVEQLATVAFNQTKEAVNLILTAETEVKKFGNTLEAIQAVVEDAEKQQVEEKAGVRIWLNRLSDVSYEMVDVLDTWNYEILEQQATGVPADEKKRTSKKVKCLRTLNLSDNDIEELPEEIGELIHLRYLDLSWNHKLEKLPDSLGNLYNLQTLLLTDCESIRRLPENMGNLINLRHLYNMYCFDLKYLPRGLTRLTNLQTLNNCPVRPDDSDPGERFKLGELGSLGQLQGSLVIKLKGKSKDATSEAQKACLSNKKLQTLVLDFSKLHKDHVPVLEALRPHLDLEYLKINDYGGTTAPSWMISLQTLRSLTLRRWNGCECLPSLGQLPLLEELYVEGMRKVKRVGDEFLGTMGTQTSSSLLFPKLKKLKFYGMAEWEEWEGGVGAGDVVTIMPCLVSLEIEYCRKLVNLPIFLLKTPIRNVTIELCPSIIMPDWPENCVVDIQEDSAFLR